MSIIIQNPNRLNHLLALFKLSKDDLLRILNEGKAKPLAERDIFSDEIKISLLKQIDKVFNKGLSYYIDPADPVKAPDESIFFRKDKLNVQLNLTAKQVVNKYEDEKLLFSALIKLSDIETKRALPIYKISDSPATAAQHVRNKLRGLFGSNKSDLKFLKDLISALADLNILVFEYVESPVKKLKANIDGFYISPNVIVVKWQRYKKREIFTLLHEVGHYLLNDEDVDDTSISDNLISTSNKTEQWCNDFAFRFLISNNLGVFESLSIGDEDTQYYNTTIETLARITHLSVLALYTRLFFTNKISQKVHNNIANVIKSAIAQYELDEKAKQEKKNEQLIAQGKNPIAPLPKPIISPYYTNTLQVAFYNGFLNELEFCQKLHIKPNQIEAYLV